MCVLYEIFGSREDQKETLYGFLEDKRILLESQELNLSTYFNAFFPKDWVEITNLQTVFLSFHAVGSGTIQLVGVQKESKMYVEKILNEKSFEGEAECKLFFPSDWKNYTLIYPKIFSKTKVENFKSSYQTLDFPNSNQFHIGIVICTYNKPTYLFKTLDRLKSFCSDSLTLSVCVVDNAENLDPNLFQGYPNLTLIPNKNYGGSGGFTRGMLYFSDQNVTHILLMDDDIELDERIFQRIESILKFQNSTHQVFYGTMLDAHKSTFIYETSARIAYNKLRYEPINFLVNASLQKTLVLISEKESIEYAAWWFMLCPKELVLKVGYSFPFFIRVDDVEYSFRLKKIGYSIHRMNGLAIWHEPFYAKDPIWIYYYTIRNLLIHFALYPKRERFLRYIRFWMIYFLHITSYQYLFLELILGGLKDYLKGPEFLKALKPDEFHKQLVESTKKDPKLHEEKVNILHKDLEIAPFWKRGILGVVCLLTGNFFFLPAWKGKVQICEEKFLSKLSLIFGAKQIEEFFVVRKEKRSFQKNPKRAVRLFFDFLLTTFRYLFFSSSVEKKWKKAHKELVSREFWEAYLQISNSKNLEVLENKQKEMK